MSKTFSKDQLGPSIILNSGSVSDTTLSHMNNYGKYSLKYNIGVNNQSFQALKKIVSDLIRINTQEFSVRLPWLETDKMVVLNTSSRKKPATMDNTKQAIVSSAIKDGDFVKVNVTPMYWEMEDNSVVLLPTGERQVVEHTNRGVTLMLNGVMLMSEHKEEDLF